VPALGVLQHAELAGALHLGPVRGNRQDLTPRPSHGYNASRRDVVILAITSQVHTPLGFGEAMVEDWQGAGLLKTSVLKPVLTTIKQGLVLCVLGRLSAADIKTLREVVVEVIG
jgi:hypothetical protein